MVDKRKATCAFIAQVAFVLPRCLLYHDQTGYAVGLPKRVWFCNVCLVRQTTISFYTWQL